MEVDEWYFYVLCFLKEVFTIAQSILKINTEGFNLSFNQKCVI